MKLLAFLFSALVISSAYAQSDSETVHNRFHISYLFGIDYNVLQTSLPRPDSVNIGNHAGLRFGISGNLRLNNTISFVPKAELAFGNSQVIQSDGARSVTSWKVFPASVDVRLHLVFKDHRKTWKPYLVTGPSFKLPINAHVNLQRSLRYDTGALIAADFGVGLEREFRNFRFAPELRHSMGLKNISKTAGINQLYLHTFSLVLNFKGI